MPLDRIGLLELDYSGLVEAVEKTDLTKIRDVDFKELTLLADTPDGFSPIDIKRTFAYGMGILDMRTKGFVVGVLYLDKLLPAFLSSVIPSTSKPEEAILAGVGSSVMDKIVDKRTKIAIAAVGIDYILSTPYRVFHCHAHESNHTARNLWAYLAKKTGKFVVTESQSTQAENFIRITLERI